MSKENVPMERNQQIVEFIQKIDRYSSEGRKKWYKLISKRPEIISAEFFEMVNPLSGEQIDVVRAGYEAGLEIQTIKIYAKSEFDASEIMRELLNGILAGIELEKIKFYAKKEFKGWICYMNMIAKKIDIATLKKYLDMDLSVYFRVNILQALIKGGNEQRVQILCAKHWNDEQFLELFKCVENNELTLEELKVIANPDFDEYQMSEVACGYMSNLTPKMVAFYAKSEMPASAMHYIRIAFEKRFSWRKVYYLLGIFKKFDAYAVKEVCECFEEGLSIEFVKGIVEISTEKASKIHIVQNLKLVREIIGAGCSIKELHKISDISARGKTLTFKYVLEGLKKGVSIEDIKFCVTTGHYYSSEMDELFTGFKNGLTQEQVKLFSGHEFRDGSMKIVRLCLEYGMSITLAKHFIANNQWDVMKAFIAYYEEQKTEETNLYTLISGLLN